MPKVIDDNNNGDEVLVAFPAHSMEEETNND